MFLLGLYNVQFFSYIMQFVVKVSDLQHVSFQMDKSFDSQYAWIF